MKTLSVILILSSASIVGLANMPKKPLPPRPVFQSRSLSPAPVAPAVVKAMPAAAMQAFGTWYAIEITGPNGRGYTAVVNSTIGRPAGIVFCGPFPTSQQCLDQLDRQGGIWLGGGVGGHMPAKALATIIDPWP